MLTEAKLAVLDHFWDASKLVGELFFVRIAECSQLCVCSVLRGSAAALHLYPLQVSSHLSPAAVLFTGSELQLLLRDELEIWAGEKKESLQNQISLQRWMGTQVVRSDSQTVLN